MPRSSIVVAVVLAGSLTAWAQVTAPYSETFDAGSLPAGWTTTSSSATVVWNADYDVACDPVGDGFGGTGPDGPRVGTSGGSLNFNDGSTYDDASVLDVFGDATSPLIDVSGLAGTVFISWANNYETEWYSWGAPGFDECRLTILDGTGTPVPGLDSLTVGDNITFPGSYDIDGGIMGTRSIITRDISAELTAAGVTTIQVRFTFQTFDTVDNAWNGWFVDNLSVTCPDVIPPSVPTNILPVDASIVPSPPGVLLDWSDSTDTSSCGPGTVANYEVQLDDDPAFGSIDFTASPTVSNATTGVLVPDTYYWRVRAIDGVGLMSVFSTVTSFIVEPPLPPTADSLFVNESSQGAQSGDAGFVDPVIDRQPHFSAIYRDGNVTDSAVSLRWQVAEDPLFTTIVFDSLTVPLSPNLPKDSRTPDLVIPIELNKDTVYFWRIQFTDLGGLTGAFSATQSFRIGDDFEFGVRAGSSNHSRRCFVASAAWSPDAAPVGRLLNLRSGWLESASVGRTMTRAYAGTAPSSARALSSTDSGRALARIVLAPVALAAGAANAVGMLIALALLLIVVSGLRRW